MEVKKSKKAELESHKGTWMLMGFIMVLAFMFMAFEWAQHDKQINVNMGVSDLVFTADLIPITVPDKPLPPPPAPPRPVDEFIITEDDSTVPESAIGGTEFTSDAVVPVYIPPVTIEETPDETEIVVFAEVMPMFPGGVSALNAFLSKNIKYPAIPQENGIGGRVVVQFIVDRDGSITDPVVIRGVHPHLDKEALRVIGLMPKWNPGMQNRKTVRVKFTLPVVFKLQ